MLFAGLTVAVSISGLAVVGIPFVTKLGVGAAMTVVGAVVTAVTLLPAVLALLGHRIDWGRLPQPRPKRAESTEARSTASSTAGVASSPGTRSPWRSPRSPVVLLLAIPATDQRLGTADAGTNPQDTTTRKAYDLLAEGFGPGFNGPLLVAVDQTDDPHAAEELAKAISEDPGVATVARRWSTRPATPPRSRSSSPPRRSPRRPPTPWTGSGTRSSPRRSRARRRGVRRRRDRVVRGHRHARSTTGWAGSCSTSWASRS